MDTVVHLQLEVEALKYVQSGPSKLAMKTLPVQSRPAVFTSTKVRYLHPPKCRKFLKEKELPAGTRVWDGCKGGADMENIFKTIQSLTRTMKQW